MNKIFQHMRLTVLCAALASGAAFAQSTQQADFIVALVNSEPITQRELLLQTLRTEKRLAAQGAAIAPRATLLKEVLERLINERVQLQEAAETGIKATDPEIDDALASVAAQNGMTVSQLLARLAEEGVSADKFRTDLRDELLITKFRERELDRRTQVSDAQVREHLRQQSAQSGQASLELNLAQILVPLPDKPDTATINATRDRALSIRNRLLKGEDFTKLAEQSSANYNGGAGVVLGLKNASRYPEAFVLATQSLGVSAISPLVQTEAGFFILKVLDKRQSDLPSMKVTQTRARHILLKTGAQLPEAEAVRRLSDIRLQILSKQTPFANLAKAHSQDGSAEQGGELGWVGPGQFVPEFESVMNQLKPGQISTPVVSRYGVHLIEVMDRREVQVSADEQIEIVRAQLREQKAQEVFPNWLSELRANAYVEYRQAPQN